MPSPSAMPEASIEKNAAGGHKGPRVLRQFNNVAFMDDITVLAQDNTGGQVLLDATQEFETWSNMRLNLNKTVVVEPSATGQKFSNGRPTVPFLGWRFTDNFRNVSDGIFLGTFRIRSETLSKTHRFVFAESTGAPRQPTLSQIVFRKELISHIRFQNRLICELIGV